MAGEKGGRVLVVEDAASGTRLDKWLADPARLGSRGRAATALLHGRVWLNDVEMTLADGARRVAPGDAVRMWMDRPGSAARHGPRKSSTLDIVYEDDDVLVLDKPAGLLSVPLPGRRDLDSLASHVQDYWRSHRGRTPLPVHRLDRDTSGLVVFARTPRAQARMRDQFASRSPERVYLAVLYGAPSPGEGAWRSWLSWDSASRVQRVARARASRAYEAISRYRTLEVFARDAASLVEVRLVTGKRHQIRALAWLAGHPLVGEKVYTGPPAPAPAEVVPFARQALHATRLAFLHPTSGDRLVFDLPPPGDFRSLLTRLRG